MQTEVTFLGHIVGCTGLACDPIQISAVHAWHAPASVKQVRQFVGFVGYYLRFIQNFAELSEPLLQALILGFPTEDDQFILDTDASLFAVLNQLQEDREIVIAYASGCLRLSQRHYCTTRREMLAYLRGAVGMLARWYMLLGQFSVTFEYRPGSQHADGLSRQCGQCLRPDCSVSSPDVSTRETESMSAMLDQPFAVSAMGDSMDLLPELSGETWVAATHLNEVTGDLPPSSREPDLITASRIDKTLGTDRFTSVVV